MTTDKNIDKKLEELAQSISPDDKLVEDVMRQVDAMSAGETSEKPKNKLLIRRIIMNRFTQITAAAVIIIGIVLLVTVLDKSTTSAYAIEQTLQAGHSVRFLHIKGYVKQHNEPVEIWGEFGPNSQVNNIRIHKPEWMEPEDGETIIVWKENQAQVWAKKKKTLRTTSDENFAAWILQLVEQFDPKLAVENLHREQQQNKVKIEIEEPSEKTRPIIVTATHTEENDSPFQRRVFFVDQMTKLVNSVELYKLQDGKYQNIARFEYYNYNQPIEPEMFTIEDIPADVTIEESEKSI